MAKATLTFTLPEENSEFTSAKRGGEYHTFIYEFTNFLRGKVKYGGDKDQKEWGHVYDEWWNQLKESNIDPYEE